MTPAAALGVLWALLVLGGAIAAGPVPRPVRGLVPPRDARPGPVERVGLLLADRLARTGLPVGAAPPRHLGLAALATVPLAVVAPGTALLPLVAALTLPALAGRRSARRRREAIDADLPDVVDLLSLAFGAGLNVSLAIEAVGRRGTGPLAAELAVVAAEVGRGRPLAEALEALPARTSETVHPLVAALVAGDRYGAPLLEGLERLAADVRALRRRRCEEAARRVPVQLLFPLVTCILPAFALLTVAPLVASALRGLRL